MAIEMQLKRDGRDPLYRQIADQIRAGIRDGRLEPGERLPTVRVLAEELEITRLTVHKAFRELQADGILEATVGRGTFVRATVSATSSPNDPSVRLTADRVMADIQKFTGESGMRNLAHAEPDPDLIPAEAFWDCLVDLRADASSHMQYVSPQGDQGLREALSVFLESRGIQADPDEILVTSGVTQGMSLVAGALAKPGDRVAVEQPTYLGLLHILEAQGLRPIGIPLDPEGPRLDGLDRVIAQDRPRFFYTIATFHNPTGQSMSRRRRRDLLSLAERHGLFLIEDDIYHHLAYQSPPPPTLKSMDRKGLVVYLDGLSKAALPGIRAGYGVVSRPLLDRMLSLRRAADLCGPLTLQRALAEFLRRGCMKKHMQRILPIYRRRRDAILAALEETMPAGVVWTRPEGGFSCWLTLPGRESFGDLYRAALERGLVFAPGEVFLVDSDPRVHLRLCFGNRPEKVIREGVGILADLIRERLQGEKRVRDAIPDRSPLV